MLREKSHVEEIMSSNAIARYPDGYFSHLFVAKLYLCLERQK